MTCKRCGEAFVRPNRKGPEPLYCAECKPLAKREKNRVSDRNYVRQNPEERRAYAQAYGLKNKQAAIETYGGHCACCGETELVFLAIDHIDDNGAQHRRELKAQGLNGNGFYRHLRMENYPAGYQVLCFNCNWAKSHGGCPHAAPILLVQES